MGVVDRGGDEPSAAVLGPTDEDMEALLSLTADSPPEEVLAVQKRFQKFNGSRPWRPRAGPPRAAGGQFTAGEARLPGDSRGREQKCVNCGKAGHMAAQCRSPKKDPSERPCFGCGESGHVMANCPKRGKPLKVLTTSTGEAVSFGCLEVVPAATQESRERGRSRLTRQPQPKLLRKEEHGWAAPRKTCRASQPASARKPTLADFVRKDVFTQLAELNDDADEQSPDVPTVVASVGPLASLPPTSTGTGWTGRPGYHRATSAEANSGAADVAEEGEPNPDAEAECEDQWEILKSLIPGYIGPEERRRRAEYDLKVKRYHDRARVVPAEKQQDQLGSCWAFTEDDGEKDKVANIAEVVYPEGFELLAHITEVPKYLHLEVVLDSGAGAHVINKKACPGCEIQESEMSKAGAAFLAADGGRMKNYGEVKFNLMSPDSQGGAHRITSKFEVADVTRALWSVGLICDSGLSVKFTSERAWVLDPSGRELCVFHRTNGLYIADVRIENPIHEYFQRPGR